MSNGNTFGRPLVIRDVHGDEVWIESGLNSPNGVLVRPKGSIYYRTTPAEQWQNTSGANTWTQIASGSMGAHFATDAFIYFGNSDNYQIGYVSSAIPYLPFSVPPGTDFPGWVISSTLTDDSPGPGIASAVVFGTQYTLARAGEVGKDSGYLVYYTGSTDAELGAAGGDVSGLLFKGGDAKGTVTGSGGTSGNTKEFIWTTGYSDDGETGGFKFASGSGKTGSGGYSFLVGDVQAGGGPGPFVFSGNRNPALGGLTSTMEMENVSLISLGVTQADSTTTPLLIKVLTFLGARTDTITVNLGATLGSKAYIVGVRAVKTTNVGGLAAQVLVSTPTGTVTTLPLTGVAVGIAVEGGQTGATFTPANAILNNLEGFDVAVSGANCECVVYLTYAQG